MLGPTILANCELPTPLDSALPSGTVDDRGRWPPNDDDGGICDKIDLLLATVLRPSNLAVIEETDDPDPDAIGGDVGRARLTVLEDLGLVRSTDCLLVEDPCWAT